MEREVRRPIDSPEALRAELREQTGKEQQHRLGAMLWELVKTVAVVLVLVIFIRAYVVEAYVIHGASMEPTFHHRERLLISKTLLVGELQRGDIVVFVHPEEPDKRLIKRLVGLPGEVVEIRGSTVYIDGVPIDEPYLSPDQSTYYYYPPHRVPDGHYFVLGDNRPVSNDSRSRQIGDIAQSAVLGRAVFKFYPTVETY